MSNLLKNLFPDTYDKLRIIKTYRRTFKRFPNIINPERFSEKLVRERIYYRNSDRFLSATADKWGVREYVAKTIGSQWLAKVHLVTNNPSEIDFDSLPYPVVFKSTHGTGHVSILHSRDSFDEEKIRKECATWLKQKFPLWYKHIPPQIIVEEFLRENPNEPGINKVPLDYKYFVFSGKVQFIVVDIGRYGEHKRSLFTPDWTYMDEKYRFPKAGPLPRPTNLEAMTKAAEKLSANRGFVRVDFYDLGSRAVFGEITHSPNASIVMFEDKFDKKISEFWKH